MCVFVFLYIRVYFIRESSIRDTSIKKKKKRVYETFICEREMQHTWGTEPIEIFKFKKERCFQSISFWCLSLSKYWNLAWLLVHSFLFEDGWVANMKCWHVFVTSWFLFFDKFDNYFLNIEFNNKKMKVPRFSFYTS